MLDASAKQVIAEMHRAPVQRVIDRLLPLLEEYRERTGATLVLMADQIEKVGLRRRDGGRISASHLGRLISTSRTKRRRKSKASQADLARLAAPPSASTQRWSDRPPRQLKTVSETVRNSHQTTEQN